MWVYQTGSTGPRTLSGYITGRHPAGVCYNGRDRGAIDNTLMSSLS